MSILIRPATPADIPAITRIYAHAVETGTASFELTAPDEVEMARRMDDLVPKGFPYLVAETDGHLAGYAYAALYRESLSEFGQSALPIGIHSPGYVAETDEQAREELWPDYKRMRDQIGAERGWPPMRRAEFDHEAEHGSLYVGAPETVARRIAATAKALGASRFDLKYSAGMLAHEKLMQCITLYGSKVIPMVREMLA